MSRLLAAVDSSLAARPVLAMARAVAPYFGAGVEAVHVREGGSQTVESEAAAAGVPLVLLSGDPAEQLCAVVAEDDVVGLVVGAHRHAVSRHVGHLPMMLATASDKPVVVVQPSATPPPRLQRVVVAFAATRAELRRAVRLIDATGLEVTVVHVDDERTVPSFSDQVQHETEAYASEFFARFLPGLSHTRLDLRIGQVTDEILSACHDWEAELLAVGWPEGGEAGRGRTALELLDRSPVPVLLVGTR